MSASMKHIKLFFIGKALKNAEQDTQKYNVLWGLPVLSSDAISSVAYACEEILLILVPVVGLASYRPMLGATAIIIALLFILVFCYRQVISAYPQGGGAYSVARDNLGQTPSLFAAAALIVDYVLTIAVSSCSGTAAITSAFSQLAPFKIELTVAFIVLLTLGNLRGLKESSVLFGLPTYVFIISIIIMLITGIAKVLFSGGIAAPASVFVQPAQDLTAFLFLRAFSSGCSALTGVEAISNSVSNFKNPAQRKAKVTLTLLAITVLVIFGGMSVLAMLCQAVPMSNVTVTAQIAMAVFGNGTFMFYLIQVMTAIILLLAANTAYNGLPPLMSLLAKDRFLPRRFNARGDRLVFSNGIIFAAILSIALVIFFRANTHLLIPLYSVGVFLSFTIAQSGMVKHWYDRKQKNWQHKALVNGIGAVVTAVVCSVIVITKFTLGAWIVLVVLAILVVLMWRIKRHYDLVKEELALNEKATNLIAYQAPTNYILIPVEVVDKAFIKTLNYALSLGGPIELYHVGTSATVARRLRKQYAKLKIDVPLVIEKTPYRNMSETLLAHIDKRHSELAEKETLTIVMSRLVTRKWWHYALHNQTALFLEASLLERRDIAVVSIPYIIHE